MAPSDVSGRSDAGHEPGERIATVTYLFGAGTFDSASHGETQPDLASEGSAPISASHPVFRDEAPLAALRSAVAAIPAAGSDHHDSETTKPERGKFDRVSNVSMYALARRGMSSREMHDYLIGREFDEVAVDEEITRLEGVGLLDDESLAETLVRTLRDRKGLGRSAVTAELRRRHVDGDAIEEALGNLDDDELERATEIAMKRSPQLRALDAVTAKRRLGAFLMRKGYSSSVISTAVQRALAPSGPSFR